MRRPYRYSPLKDGEIRLLRLENVSWGPIINSPIVSIHHRRLSEVKNQYEALSYVWGDELHPQLLYCKPDLHFRVTANLMAALRRLQRRLVPGKPSLELWVDALCIDQENTEERNSQVMFMRDIYSSAKRVVAYIGDSADDSNLALEFLADLQRRYYLLVDSDERFRNYRRPDWLLDVKKRNDKTTNDELRKMYMEMDMTEFVQYCKRAVGENETVLFDRFDQKQIQTALVALMSRPYFQRAWIVQEIVVAQEVVMYCGMAECKTGSLFNAFVYYFPDAGVQWNRAVSGHDIAKFYEGVQLFISTASLRDKYHHGSGTLGMRQLLSDFRTARATIPVDKIFAFLGICVEEDLNSLKPDYEKSKGEVYMWIAQYFIKAGQGEDLFYEAARSDHDSKELPSWIPDWSVVPSRVMLGHTLSKTDRYAFGYKASGPVKNRPPVHFRVSGDKLLARGAIIQTVSVVGLSPVKRRDDVGNSFNLLRVVKDMIVFRERLTSYPTKEDVDSVLATILEADQPFDTITTNLHESHEGRSILLEINPIMLRVILNLRDAPFAAALRQGNPRIMQNIMRAVSGRRFAMTNRSYAGLVPAATQPGDKVCILQGLRVPFVLRKDGDGYVLIGDCYVHGMMQGEMLAEPNVLNMQNIEIH